MVRAVAERRVWYSASAQESIRAPQQLRQVLLDGVRVIQSPEALHGLLHAGPAFAPTLLQEGEISGARELYAEHPEEQTLWYDAIRAHLGDAPAMAGFSRDDAPGKSLSQVIRQANAAASAPSRRRRPPPRRSRAARRRSLAASSAASSAAARRRPSPPTARRPPPPRGRRACTR